VPVLTILSDFGSISAEAYFMAFNWGKSVRDFFAGKVVFAFHGSEIRLS
jgi:hypothetical protein